MLNSFPKKKRKDKSSVQLIIHPVPLQISIFSSPHPATAELMSCNYWSPCVLEPPPATPLKKQDKETNSGVPNQNNKDKLSHYI